MKSPFPGMDPYLEQHWRDVHSRLIVYLCDAIQEGLPESLVARVEERVLLEAEAGPGRGLYPDVRVVERKPPTPATPESPVAVAEPLTIRMQAEPLTEGFIEVIDVVSGNRVVTVVEVLSLSNKQPGQNRDLYLQKQREILDASVNLVEIDLLRTGQRRLALGSWPPSEPLTAYAVCVARGDRRGEFQLYPMPLRQRLPRFRIPLRPTDAGVVLDLQAVVDQCYRGGRYGSTTNYKAEPEPPLEADDAKWADELLRAAGKR